MGILWEYSEVIVMYLDGVMMNVFCIDLIMYLVGVLEWMVIKDEILVFIEEMLDIMVLKWYLFV